MSLTTVPEQGPLASDRAWAHFWHFAQLREGSGHAGMKRRATAGFTVFV
ncbi:hypothetical protein ACFY7H_17050 [Streptomyces sp. NPDC012794]